MRFHKFETVREGPIWINLDAISAVSGDRGYGTQIVVDGWFKVVNMSLPDVLALVEGPRLEPAESPEVRMPPPDTYEEELAREKRRNENKVPTEQGFTDPNVEIWKGPVAGAIIKELDWIRKCWDRGTSSKIMREYLDDRIAELRGEA